MEDFEIVIKTIIIPLVEFKISFLQEYSVEG